jgi:hypothetical protein
MRIALRQERQDIAGVGATSRKRSVAARMLGSAGRGFRSAPLVASVPAVVAAAAA